MRKRSALVLNGVFESFNFRLTMRLHNTPHLRTCLPYKQCSAGFDGEMNQMTNGWWSSITRTTPPWASGMSSPKARGEASLLRVRTTNLRSCSAEDVRASALIPWNHLKRVRFSFNTLKWILKQHLKMFMRLP